MMSEKKFAVNDAINLALAVLVLPFLLLSLYNHPQNDDYVFAVATKNFGIVSANIGWYMSWTGRYFSTALLSINPLVFDSFIGFKIAAVFVIILLSVSIYYFVDKLFLKQLTVKEKCTATFIFLLLYLFKMPNLVEGLYWLAGSVTYLLGTVLLLTICGILFRIFRDNEVVFGTRSAIILAAFVLCAAGTNEVTMVVLLELSLLVAAYSIIKRHDRLLAIVLLISSCLSGALVTLAPGTSVRLNSVPNHELTFALLNSLKVGATSLTEWLFLTPILPITVAASPFLAKRLGRSCLSPLSKSLAVLAFLGIYFSLFFPSFYGTGLIEPRTVNAIYAVFLIGYLLVFIMFVDQLGSFSQKLSNNHRPFYRYLLIAWIAVTVTVPASNHKIAIEDLMTGRAYGYDRELKQRYYMIRDCDRIICAVPALQSKPKSIYFFENAVDNGKDDEFYKRYKLKYANYFGRLKIELQ